MTNADEHPLDLLAEYVDGALDPDSRAAVERHLAGCDRCSEEVALARRGRVALEALREEPAPAGLGLPVRREARAARGWRVAGVAAVAAAVLLGAVVVGQGLFTVEGEPAGPSTGPRAAFEGPEEAEGGGQGGQANRSSGGALAGDIPAPEVAASEIQYGIIQHDYSAAELVDLGRRLRDRANQALAEGFPPTSNAFFEDFDFQALSPEVRRADRCVEKEVPPGQPVVPFLIQGASFQGEPVYIAAFLQGTAETARYDRLLIWVVDREICALRYYASHRL